jgi:hypothetical protein
MRLIPVLSLAACTEWMPPPPAQEAPEREAGADCPVIGEAVFYTQSAWGTLADALAADPSPCVDYWVSLPAYSEHKEDPRGGGEPELMRARSPQVHALAEFHWTTWSSDSRSWYDKGVEFRRRMDDAGYDVLAGDTWAVNELPSSVRSDDAVRQNVEDLVRGLYTGPAGDPPAKGVVWTVGMGQNTTNFSVYEPNLQDWLSDSHFWGQVNLYVRWWGQEVYADPSYTCVSGQSVASKSTQINEYVEHFARYADIGPDAANTAQSYLNRAYTPTMNAVWQANSGYGNTKIDLVQMEHFVSHEVYAARSWSNSHSYPDGRLGFAWAKESGVSDDDLEVLAERLASAIHYAYDEGGGTAAGACSPSGAYTWCQCSVSGAKFNDGWETFAVW